MNVQKLFKWKYWPWQIVYAPIIPQYLYYAIKEGSLFYAFAVNPGIETGGLLIESKFDILKKIPKKYIPQTRKVKPQWDAIQQVAKKTCFPLIIKPNFGERGTGVEKINSEKELKKYFLTIQKNREYIIQEYIDEPFEAGIFFCKEPGKKGKVTSVVIKEFLSVTGDGKSSLRSLLKKDFRGALQEEKLAQRMNLKKIIPKNQKELLEPIGNHSRGTKFVNGNQLIKKKLHQTFDLLAKEIEGFNYGRFDIRARSAKHLEEGEFCILELNGAKSEPGHVYDPTVSLRKAYGSLWQHWHFMWKIARKNHQRGVAYPSFSEGKKALKKYFLFH